MLRIAAAAVLACLALAPAAVAVEQGGSDASRSLLDRLLPVEDLNGREWTRETLEGKVVIIDFWATWCAPCLAELPNMKRLHELHGGDKLVILAVSMDQVDRRTLRRWLRDHEVGWPQVHDNRGFDGRLARGLRVESVPRTFVFDRHSRLVATDLRGVALEATVRLLVVSALDSPRGAAGPTKSWVQNMSGPGE